MKNKKQLILCVLNFLDNESSFEKRFTQTELANTISEFCPCDRKTVGRNIKFLQEMGYPIQKTPRGYYMDKAFSDEEITIVTEAIRSFHGKDIIEKEILAKKVEDALHKRYRR